MRDQAQALRRDIALFQESVAKFAGLLAKADLRVVFRGGECKTDGKTLVLPSMDALVSMDPVAVGEAQKFVDAMIGFVNHEVGHILFTDFDVWRAQKHQSKHVRALVNVIEDVFVERKMAEVWSGSGENLERYARYFLEREGPVMQAKDSFTQVCLLLMMMAKGHHDDAKAYFSPEIVAWGEEALCAYAARMREVDSTGESVELALEVYEAIRDAFSPAQQSQGGQSEQEPDEHQAGGAEDEGGDEPPGNEPPDEPDERPSEEQRQEDAPNHAGSKEPLAKCDDGSATDEHKTQADQQTDQGAWVSRQFDALVSDADVRRGYAVYTTEGDYTGPMRQNTSQRSAHAMAAVIRYLETLADNCAGPLRSTLTRVLKARGTAYQVRDLAHGALDRRRLWKIPHASVLGGAPRVRKAAIVAETHNVAVFVAINESQSMGLSAESNYSVLATRPPPHEQFVTRMDMAAAAGLVIGDVLHALRIPFGVIGHTTNSFSSGWDVGQIRYKDVCLKNPEASRLWSRWGDITIEWVKDFAQPWPQRRIWMGGLHFQNNTYDGEVVRFAARQLLDQRQVDRRILIMLDDGDPCPDLYTVCSAQHQDYLIKSVRVVEGQGIDVLGVGMACNLQRYYPRNISVANLTDLPQALLTSLGGLLRSKTA